MMCRQACFFATLTIMCFYLLALSTKKAPDRGREKHRRNPIRRTCSGMMIGSVMLLFAIFQKWLPGGLPYWCVFALASLALIAFAVAWLTKGARSSPIRSDNGRSRSGTTAIYSTVYTNSARNVPGAVCLLTPATPVSLSLNPGAGASHYCGARACRWLITRLDRSYINAMFRTKLAGSLLKNQIVYEQQPFACSYNSRPFS